MARRYSKKVTKKRIFRLSPKDAEIIINEEFMTPKGYRIQKRFIFKPEKPDNSGIKIYFNHNKELENGNGTD